VQEGAGATARTATLLLGMLEEGDPAGPAPAAAAQAKSGSGR
jgi:hypothetical protein